MQITLWNFSGVILIILLLSSGAVVLVRRYVKKEELRSHHDVTDPLLAVIGTLFAILLGFMLANAMQRFEQARLNVEHEAEGVGDVFRLAGGLPEPVKAKLRQECVEYTSTIIKDEWPALQDHVVREKAMLVLNNIWEDTRSYEPKTQGQSNLHQYLIQAVEQVGEARRTRVAELKYSLPPSLWFIIIFGGLSTIAFTYFFAIDSIRLQILMTGTVTVLVCLNVYVLAGYDAPFSGDIALTPAPFEIVDALMKRQLANHAP